MKTEKINLKRKKMILIYRKMDETLIRFGKYKGQNYRYILFNDLSYCIWVLTTFSKHKDYNDFKDYLGNKILIVENIDEIPNDLRISFIGKYDYFIKYKNEVDFEEYIKNIQYKGIDLNRPFPYLYLNKVFPEQYPIPISKKFYLYNQQNKQFKLI